MDRINQLKQDYYMDIMALRDEFKLAADQLREDYKNNKITKEYISREMTQLKYSFKMQSLIYQDRLEREINYLQ